MAIRDKSINVGLYIDDNDGQQWEKQGSSFWRLGISLRAKNDKEAECTNRCPICRDNFQELLEGLKFIDVRTTVEFDQKIRDLLAKHQEIREIVFTCNPVGEPLLYIETIKLLLPIIQIVINDLARPFTIRLNTNANSLQDPSIVLAELKRLGLTTVCISINALNEADYIRFCKPKYKGAWDRFMLFISAAREIFKNQVIFTYIDRSKNKVPEKYRQGRFSSKKLEEFLKQTFGEANYVLLPRQYLGKKNIALHRFPIQDRFEYDKRGKIIKW